MLSEYFFETLSIMTCYFKTIGENYSKEKVNKISKNNPFNREIPYYLEMVELEEFSSWLQNSLDTKEDNKHMARVIYDSPGMGKTSAVSHYSRKHGYYVPFNVKNLKTAFTDIDKDLPEQLILTELKRIYELYFTKFAKRLVDNVIDEINNNPNEKNVKMKDISQLNSKEAVASPIEDLKDCNVILHFDEIQEWAGDLNYTALKDNDYIQKNQYASLLISKFVAALTSVIGSRCMKVVLTGTNCDVNKHLIFGSSLIPSDTLLPEFNESYVRKVLEYFLTEQTMAFITEKGICQILSGRPRNLQYFLFCLYDMPYESIETALDNAYLKYKAEHSKFGGMGAADAVFDSMLALIFYRSLGGTKKDNKIQFPAGCISTNIRNLSMVGLLRIQIDTQGDYLTIPYPWLLDYLKDISNNINIKYYEELVQAAAIIKSNALTGIGVVFQVALAIELMLPSSELVQMISKKSGIELRPKYFDSLVPFTLFNEIHDKFKKLMNSVFIIRDMASNEKGYKRYVDIACQLSSQAADVCLRMEAKNYSNVGNDSTLRADCLSFFKACQGDFKSGLKYINAFICTKEMYSNIKTNSKYKRELGAFLDIKNGHQSYIILEDVIHQPGLVLPFKELSDAKQHLQGNWDSNPAFANLKNIFHPKIVINELDIKDQKNLKAFLKRKYPNASQFQGYMAKGIFVINVVMEHEYSDLKALLDMAGVVMLVPNKIN